MIPIVQIEIDTFVNVVWNSHRIREQKNTYLLDGVPNHIYSFADKYGLEECGMELQFTNWWNNNYAIIHYMKLLF